MIRRVPAALAAALALLAAPLPAAAGLYSEAPALAARVQAGDLPPVSERLPWAPRFAEMIPGQTPGRYGGTIRSLIGKAKDTKVMFVYGYARLIGYDVNLDLVPDILQSYEVEENRIFTFKLRPNHHWSDGHPFTTEDFRYWWEDVANNPQLSPSGPPWQMLVEGQPPKVEILDETTIRYSWKAPNPFFLSALAGAAPLIIYRPAHYMKRLHADYADADSLAKLAEEHSARNWAALHNKLDNMYRMDNPDLPTLQPWMATTERPATRFEFVRNPYFHRVDPRGRQLPYIDRWVLSVASPALIAAKTATGESDLQVRSIAFSDYTFLKQNEPGEDYKVLLWKTGVGANKALYPNLNAQDPAWREVLRDHRVRQALSLGINRHEINQVVYYGLAAETGNSLLPISPLSQPGFREAWARHDPDTANALLDLAGLDQYDDEERRLLPNGEPMVMVVDTPGQDSQDSDILELVADQWRELGIEVVTRPSQLEVFRNRVFSGRAIMTIGTGLENGVATPDMSPGELAPTAQHQYQWPKWGQYYETSGQAGTEPDTPLAVTLLTLYQGWIDAISTEEKVRMWHEMLTLFADSVVTIGLVSEALQPIVAHQDLRNLPSKAIYAWEPYAHFGVYGTDILYYGK